MAVGDIHALLQSPEQDFPGVGGEALVATASRQSRWRYCRLVMASNVLYLLRNLFAIKSHPPKCLSAGMTAGPFWCARLRSGNLYWAQGLPPGCSQEQRVGCS